MSRMRQRTAWGTTCEVAFLNNTKRRQSRPHSAPREIKLNHVWRGTSQKRDQDHTKGPTTSLRVNYQRLVAVQKPCSDVSFCEDKWKDSGRKKRLLDYDIGNAQQHSLLHGPGPHKSESRQSRSASMHKTTFHTDRLNEHHVSWRLLIPQKQGFWYASKRHRSWRAAITIHFFHHFASQVENVVLSTQDDSVLTKDIWQGKQGNLRNFHELLRNGRNKATNFTHADLACDVLMCRRKNKLQELTCIIGMAQGGDLQWTARLLQESSGTFINGQTTLYCVKSPTQPQHECDSYQIQPVSMATGVLQLVWWSSSSSTPSSTGWLKWNVTLVFASRTVPGTSPIICVQLVSRVATMLFSSLTTNTRTALLSLSSPCVGLASSEALVGQRRFRCLSAHLLAFPPVRCGHWTLNLPCVPSQIRWSS